MNNYLFIIILLHLLNITPTASASSALGYLNLVSRLDYLNNYRELTAAESRSPSATSEKVKKWCGDMRAGQKGNDTRVSLCLKDLLRHTIITTGYLLQKQLKSAVDYAKKVELRTATKECKKARDVFLKSCCTGTPNDCEWVETLDELGAASSHIADLLLGDSDIRKNYFASV